MAKNTVTAPLVLVKNEEGATEYFYRGATLPSYVKGDALKVLVADGLVGSEDDLAPPAGEDEPPADVMSEGSDPGDFSVAQVQAYLANASEEEKARVLQLEADGKARTTLVGSGS